MPENCRKISRYARQEVHPEIPVVTIRSKIKNANSQSILLAPLEIRDAVFPEALLQ